jgi:glyceraldehyde 3-phosphate dehydrogenase
MHIKAGAKFVIISVSQKRVDIPNVVHGVNSADGKTDVVFSCASCALQIILALY